MFCWTTHYAQTQRRLESPKNARFRSRLRSSTPPCGAEARYYFHIGKGNGGLAADAIDSASSFLPSCGQILAVLLDQGISYQRIGVLRWCSTSIRTRLRVRISLSAASRNLSKLSSVGSATAASSASSRSASVRSLGRVKPDRPHADCGCPPQILFPSLCAYSPIIDLCRSTRKGQNLYQLLIGAQNKLGQRRLDCETGHRSHQGPVLL